MKCDRCDQPGHIFTPRPEKGARLHLHLSDNDERLFHMMPRQPRGPWLRITDTLTGNQWDVRPARCSLDCFCDAVARRVRS